MYPNKLYKFTNKKNVFEIWDFFAFLKYEFDVITNNDNWHKF